MAYFRHVLFEECMLALGSNLAKVYVFTMDKVLHCSQVIANTQRSCFLCFSEAMQLWWMQY
jgi:hypothetical protein